MKLSEELLSQYLFLHFYYALGWEPHLTSPLSFGVIDILFSQYKAKNVEYTPQKEKHQPCILAKRDEYLVKIEDPQSIN